MMIVSKRIARSYNRTHTPRECEVDHIIVELKLQVARIPRVDGAVRTAGQVALPNLAFQLPLLLTLGHLRDVTFAQTRWTSGILDD